MRSSVWYLNKEYILIPQTYIKALTEHYFMEFMKNAQCGYSYLMLCVALEAFTDVGRGFLHVSNVFLLTVCLGQHQRKYRIYTLLALCEGSTPVTISWRDHVSLYASRDFIFSKGWYFLISFIDFVLDFRSNDPRVIHDIISRDWNDILFSFYLVTRQLRY